VASASSPPPTATTAKPVLCANTGERPSSARLAPVQDADRIGEDAEQPFDAATQRRYDEFVRRLVKSKIYQRFEELARNRSQNNFASATTIAAPVEPAFTAPEHAPVSQAEPSFEEHRPDELIKAVPGMRLDVLMSLQRNNN
jgi:hypothetical protein